VIPGEQLAFSDAELTYLAIALDRDFFPATPLPELDVDSWKVVERGLVARGVVRGRFRLKIDDDVAAVLHAVLDADRSLWAKLGYAEGVGQTHGQILFFKGNDVVRQRTTADGTTTLVVCGQDALDEILAEVVDFPAAGESREGAEATLPMVDFHEALYTAAEEGAAVAGERYPVAAGYITALADSRSSTILEYRSAGAEPDHREKLSFTESRAHGLWLAHDDPHPDGELHGVMTRVQRVTVEMAREEATSLAYRGTG
jgi:hypothetical protein